MAIDTFIENISVDRTTASTRKPPILSMRNVRVITGGKAVLALDRLSIVAGENTAILGPNGAGKSSFIRLITRDAAPDTSRRGASLALFGAANWNIFELRERIGVVSSAPLEIVRLNQPTCFEFVAAGLSGAFVLMPGTRLSRAARAATLDALKRMGISHLRRRTVGGLSEGEARRTVIARALVHRPEVLLLDEPASHLDIAAATDLRETLNGLAADGVTLIVSTHDPADIIPAVSRVILLKDGHVFADGPKDRMLTDGRIGALYGRPVRVVCTHGHFVLMVYPDPDKPEPTG